jgi:hypothetical protein
MRGLYVYSSLAGSSFSAAYNGSIIQCNIPPQTDISLVPWQSQVTHFLRILYFYQPLNSVSPFILRAVIFTNPSILYLESPTTQQTRSPCPEVLQLYF